MSSGKALPFPIERLCPQCRIRHKRVGETCGSKQCIERRGGHGFMFRMQFRLESGQCPVCEQKAQEMKITCGKKECMEEVKEAIRGTNIKIKDSLIAGKIIRVRT